MGKANFEQSMRDHIQDLGFAIEAIGSRIAENADNRVRTELTAQIAVLELRREQMEAKLHELESEPPGRWSNLKAEVEEQWNDLMRDFEERVGNLP